MVMTGALFLLLATVAVSQADLVTFTGSGTASLNNCSVRFYGQSFNIINVAFDSGSFQVCFTNDVGDMDQDCLYLNDTWMSNTVEMEENLQISPVGMEGLLPNIITYSYCNIRLTLRINSNSFIDIVLYDYSPQASVTVETHFAFPSAFTLTAVAGNMSLDSWEFTEAEGDGTVYFDVSGCRFEGDVMKSNSEKILQDTCTSMGCSAAAYLQTNSTCGPLEVCVGNNMCILSTVVCTVTGSTVFDVLDRVHSVSDRCLYTLMTKDGEFDLSAGFRERRRKDVLFLDYLKLWLPEVNETMYFEQGGRVRVGDQMLSLTANPQDFYGVDLSRDETGVTAKTTFSNMTLFFDGDTAHVTVLAEPVSGLCGDVTNSSQTTSIWEMKNYDDSEIGCDMQYNDIDNNTIECSRLSENCYLMYQDPFTACHNVTDPEPFVTACINTTCNYPPIDGLNCQFLEAYAEACYLKSDITLDPWRSGAGCSVVLQDGCQDQYCSHHEFCGENLGETRCLCRALFASKYKPTDAFGEPTVCMKNSGTVTLAACLLWAKGIDYSGLHLNDENCTGLIDEEDHMVTFSFDGSDSCGTEVMRNDSQVIFKNTIMAEDSSDYSIITSHDQVEIDFSCSYTQPNTRSLSFRIRDNPVFQTIETGVWNYSVMMNTFTDPGLVDPVGESTEIQLGQRIWLDLKTEGLDDAMVAVVTDSCWATNQSMPDVDPRYDLITDGCPADETVQMEGNGLGPSNSFSFSVFEFFEDNDVNSEAIYLHCKLELCPKEESCAPNCDENPARRRRSSRPKYEDGHAALITMVWSI